MITTNAPSRSQTSSETADPGARGYDIVIRADEDGWTAVVIDTATEQTITSGTDSDKFAAVNQAVTRWIRSDTTAQHLCDDECGNPFHPHDGRTHPEDAVFASAPTPRPADDPQQPTRRADRNHGDRA